VIHDVSATVATCGRITSRAASFRHYDLDGGQGQNRTADTVIFSHVLYQLSYLAIVEGGY
jgi:hypothetical protein